MKTTTLDQLTWEDICEICAVYHQMSTIPESKRAFESPREYYTEILNRLADAAQEEG